MDNATRRQLLMRHRQSGYPGSILDVFRAYDMGIDLLGQFEQQNNIPVAQTPQQQQQGLRPAHQAGNISQSMIFPNVPPNTPFNTVGMKAPINIEKYDEQGHLVKSYENVPPGVQNLPTGPQRGTVIETPANMQAGGDYNMARAKELGYKPDATGHYPSVDHETGMLLKSKEHPTVKLEFMSQMLSPERKMIANPTGYFGENQLQYVPRKMQSGGIKFQDTMDFIDREYGPDQFGDTLTLNAMDLISEHRQGILDAGAVRDTIAYHETGAHQRMQPNAVQIVKDKDSTSTTYGQLVPGVGRGKYMYDKPSTLTAANRVDSLASYMGLETPGFIRDLQRSEGTSRADTLTGTQQDMLYMGDLIEGPAPGKAYGAGKASLEDVWYKGHNRRKDEEAARLEFRESMRGIAQDNLRDYYFMEPKPNFFELQKKRRGGPMRKYFRLRK